ncbi:MAG: LEVG family PEP-CTERM protein [Cyanobacteria bacterium J06636_16]
MNLGKIVALRAKPVVTLTASAAVLSFTRSVAQAFDLVPRQEGEVALSNKACLTSDCFSLSPLIESVESLVDSSTGTRSSLFVDTQDTANDYGVLKFSTRDVGTSSSEGYWFRPVAFNEHGTAIEGGRLEVGTFRFTFAEVLETLTVSWFDAEKRGGTSYIAEIMTTHGIASDSDDVPNGRNGNTFTRQFNSVQSITLNLGGRQGGTGDGVSFQISTERVPEPSLLMGAAVAAVMGGVARHKQKASV